MAQSSRNCSRLGPALPPLSLETAAPRSLVSLYRWLERRPGKCKGGSDGSKSPLWAKKRDGVKAGQIASTTRACRLGKDQPTDRLETLQSMTKLALPST